MTVITKECGRYRVTIVRERGDIKVGYEFRDNGAGLEIQADATFESPFHLDNDLSHLEERSAIYPTRQWNDNVDPSYTLRDVPMVTLAIERKERRDGYLLVISAKEESVELAYRKLLDVLSDEALIGDMVDGDGLLVEEIARVVEATT